MRNEGDGGEDSWGDGFGVEEGKGRKVDVVGNAGYREKGEKFGVNGSARQTSEMMG